MKMIRNKAMENLYGQMADHIKETGSMANNMEKVSILLVKEMKNMVNGKKARESDGLEEEKVVTSEIEWYILNYVYEQPNLYNALYLMICDDSMFI